MPFFCSINQKPVDFLLDSGAAISVIHHTALPGDTNITGATTTAVSATYALLDTYHRLSHTFSLHYTSSLLFITSLWIVCWVPTFYNNTKLLWTVETLCCIFNQQTSTIYHSYYPGKKTQLQLSTTLPWNHLCRLSHLGTQCSLLQGSSIHLVKMICSVLVEPLPKLPTCPQLYSSFPEPTD